MKTRLIALGVFLVAFGFYLRHVSPSVTAGDSGEFITAAATMSLPHAPSFPFYTLVSRCFVSSVPWGSIGYRCNAFSAFTGALAVMFIFLIGLELGGGVLLSLAVAALCGVTASFWENSLVTEVFALNTLLAVALLWCLIRARTCQVYYGLFAFLLGLGLGNHHILVFMVPAFAVAVLSPRRKPGPSHLPEGEKLDSGFRRNDVLRCLLFFGLGLSIYLLLPIRSMKTPPLNWGQPTTVSRLVRTITRQDYGALTLALGETPARNVANTRRHLTQFARHMAREIPWPALLLGLVGFGLALRRKDSFAIMMLLVLLAAGPFFLLLGNLPFNAQSDGIIGRFYILPVLAFLLGGVLGGFKDKRWAPAVIAAVFVWAMGRGWAEAAAHRHGYLVLDYGRAMLRTMPAGAAFFMDGGDDAFYSLAMLRYAEGKRPDVELHDRGGLVFKNPYGDDFRKITREEKTQRRHQVEKEYLKRRPLLYSTMDSAALPGVPLKQVGFLMEANSPATGRINNAVILLRSLYPLQPNDYRTRALGSFFPFMQGKWLLSRQQVEPALAAFRRAEMMGPDVDWLQKNLGVEYARLAYSFLMANNFAASEKVYQQWIRFDPGSEQAHANLGVVYEKQGRLDAAKEQYQRTAQLFPQMADPVFNLSVLAWKDSDWPRVVELLEEVLRRRPDHLQAQGYLKVARERADSSPRRKPGSRS